MEIFAQLCLRDGRGYLIPLASRQVAAGALTLYHAQSMKAKAAKWALATSLRLGIGQPFLRRVRYTAQRLAFQTEPSLGALLAHLEETLGHVHLSIAVSLGSPGAYRKPVLVVLTRRGEALAYVKLGVNDATNALVQREVEMLQTLGQRSFHTFTVPSVLHSGWWLGHYICVQSGPGNVTSPLGGDASTALTVPKELAATHLQRVALGGGNFWADLQRRVDAIPNRYYRVTLERGMHTAAARLHGQVLPFHLSHGDLAPWNIKTSGQKLFVFDWEYGRADGIPARDVLHFFAQSYRFLEKRGPHDLCNSMRCSERIRRAVDDHWAAIKVEPPQYESCLLLYWLERLSLNAVSAASDPALPLEMQSFVQFLSDL